MLSLNQILQESKLSTEGKALENASETLSRPRSAESTVLNDTPEARKNYRSFFKCLIHSQGVIWTQGKSVSLIISDLVIGW